MFGCKTSCECLLQVFGEGSSSRCVAVQMHNLQHKFLRCVRQSKSHADPSPSTNTRVSLIQAALFYHHRDAADRRDKIGRLLQLALGDLQDSGDVEKLLQALDDGGVDLDGEDVHNGNTSS